MIHRFPIDVPSTADSAVAGGSPASSGSLLDPRLHDVEGLEDITGPQLEGEGGHDSIVSEFPRINSISACCHTITTN